jgi:hypothetical protein
VERKGRGKPEESYRQRIKEWERRKDSRPQSRIERQRGNENNAGGSWRQRSKKGKENREGEKEMDAENNGEGEKYRDEAGTGPKKERGRAKERPCEAKTWSAQCGTEGRRGTARGTEEKKKKKSPQQIRKES